MDAAHRYTDKKIVRLQKELERIYLEAEKDINRKLKEFNKRHATKEKKLLEKLAKSEINKDEFARWERGQVFIGERWKAQREQILDSMRNANRIAMEIINGYTLDAFRINSNYMSYTIEKLGNINFGFELYDKSTIVRLIRKYPDLLPKWKIDEPKDYAWSKRKLNNQIIQGITQGESLDDIAKRISKKLSSLNKNKMRTFARTAMTSAQNGGRMAQMKRAQEMGIELEKEWIATLDSHTRDSHADIDGEKVPVDKKFSNGLMYPAEAGGAPAEVYNCRCTMGCELKKYPSKYAQRWDNESGKRISDMTYKEWEKSKK